MAELIVEGPRSNDPRWLNRHWLRSYWPPLCRRRFWDLGAAARRRAARRAVAALRRRRRRVSGDAPLAPPCAESFRLGPPRRTDAAPLLRREREVEDDGEERKEREREKPCGTHIVVSAQ
uniref:Uncharacterized protein n=1 Tax=Oryza nivara TaxID=4536 RepID=A0A0E0G282_ORYNI